MSQPLVGVIPVRDIARRWGCGKRTALRRLKGYDRKIRAATGAGLLVQFGGDGERFRYFADAAVLAKYLPGLLFDDPRNPVEAKLEEAMTLLLEIRSAVCG